MASLILIMFVLSNCLSYFFVYISSQFCSIAFSLPLSLLLTHNSFVHSLTHAHIIRVLVTVIVIVWIMPSGPLRIDFRLLLLLYHLSGTLVLANSEGSKNSAPYLPSTNLTQIKCNCAPSMTSTRRKDTRNKYWRN